MNGDEPLDCETYVRTRSNALMRYGFVLTGNAHDAADLVQDALVLSVVAVRAPAGLVADPPIGPPPAPVAPQEWPRAEQVWPDAILRIPRTNAGGGD